MLLRHLPSASPLTLYSTFYPTVITPSSSPTLLLPLPHTLRNNDKNRRLLMADGLCVGVY